MSERTFLGDAQNYQSAIASDKHYRAEMESHLTPDFTARFTVWIDLAVGIYGREAIQHP